MSIESIFFDRAYVAFAADRMNFIGLRIVYMLGLTNMSINYDHLEVVGAVSNIPFHFGVPRYCYKCFAMVLPLENLMQNKENFKPVLISTVVVIV